MEELIIDRATWYRGQGSIESRLLREDGKMCCLGFYSLSCGYTKDDILGFASPTSLFLEHTRSPKSENLYPSWVFEGRANLIGKFHSDVIKGMIQVNDNHRITDEEREAQLTKLFADVGISLKFIN